MKFNAPRGTHDLWGQQAKKLKKLEQICRDVFGKYNFGEIITPTFEDAALFVKTTGETTDIVEKEMYVFADRKGRQLALRPEGTPSIVRSYIENGLAQASGAAKFFYIGPMFRYERPQAGRYREFYQLGVEYFGNASPEADAEVILLARDVLKQAGVAKIDIRLHSLGCDKCRPAFREALVDYFKPGSAAGGDLCEDCKKRVEKNPLRVLDCKIDGPKFGDAPKMEDFLCGECRAHMDKVTGLLAEAECRFTLDHKLVRGLDYYTRTIFEIRSESLGAQDALGGGGRYDKLIKELGGPDTPAVGFAFGAERVLIAAEKENPEFGLDDTKIILVATAGEALSGQAFKLAEKLRNTDFTGKVSIEGPLADRSLKSQLRLADKLGASKVIIFGEDEFKRGAVMVRDMKTQQQSEIKIENVAGEVLRSQQGFRI
jgi:histidyl-tRNA synthetase